MVKIYDYLCEDAKAIREKVFVAEQGFQNEFDEWDDKVMHAVLFLDGQAVGTGRLLPGQQQGSFVVGRIAVLQEYRGRHFGEQIMQALELEAVKAGGITISLSAQCQASGFYRTLGYVECGEPYLDEFCPHILMEKAL